MPQYLLDTNAYFKILEDNYRTSDSNSEIVNILTHNCYISELTKIEIISVIGKYARGERNKDKNVQKSYLSQAKSVLTFISRQKEKNGNIK